VEQELDNLFLLALKTGITPTDFWYGDPAWTWAYITNWEEKQREDWKKDDLSNYQLGAYVMRAIGACFNDSSDARYPEELMFYQPTTEELIERSKKQLRDLFSKM